MVSGRSESDQLRADSAGRSWNLEYSLTWNPMVEDAGKIRSDAPMKAEPSVFTLILGSIVANLSN
jgi:hypothetical protein